LPETVLVGFVPKTKIEIAVEDSERGASAI